MKKELWWALWNKNTKKLSVVRPRWATLPIAFPGEEVRRVELKMLPKAKKK